MPCALAHSRTSQLEQPVARCRRYGRRLGRAGLDAGTVGCFGAAFGRHLGHGTPVPQPADHPGNYRRSDPQRVPGIPLVPTGLRDPFESFRIRSSTRDVFTFEADLG
jgi:hypothetical protein